MGIVIDIADPVPVLAQLIAQITKAVLSDTVFPGDALPSMYRTQFFGHRLTLRRPA